MTIGFSQILSAIFIACWYRKNLIDFSLMIKDRNVIIISSIDWSFNWQGPQEIATRLAETGNRVLFIENTGVRAPKLKDLARVWQRLKYWGGEIKSNGFAEVENNLFICSPLVLPPFGSRLRTFINQFFFLPFIKKTADRLKMDNPLIISFLPTDTAGFLTKTLRGEESEIFYYVAGDFTELVSDKEILIKYEKEMVEMSDAVITIVSSLSERYDSSLAKVYTLPYGVNLEAFHNANNADAPKAVKEIISDFKAGNHPVIGYVGGFHRYIDTDLLMKSILQKKDWQWVFVGPVQETRVGLEKLPNVSFCGHQSHQDLVHFIRNFDVCIIPYTNVAFTETVVPVKLNEYLAVGKPVVSTDIPAVQEFNNVHNIIKISEDDPKDFVRAIEEFLAEPDSESIIEDRKNVAALFDWDIHIKMVYQILNSISDERRVQKKHNGNRVENNALV